LSFHIKLDPLFPCFALRPGRPHHRNAAVSGASIFPGLFQIAGAPPKAAYAVIGVFFLSHSVWVNTLIVNNLVDKIIF
jgi:hypothetical protein